MTDKQLMEILRNYDLTQQDQIFFALKKVVIAEREACAKLCEAAMTDELDDQAYYVCKNLAAAIRARREL